MSKKCSCKDLTMSTKQGLADVKAGKNTHLVSGIYGKSEGLADIKKGEKLDNWKNLLKKYK
jgi:hypothetical protein